MCASARAAPGGAGHGRRAGAPGRVSGSPAPGRRRRATLPRGLEVCLAPSSPGVPPSFISEMKLEGKCNQRRPTKEVGRGVGLKKEKKKKKSKPGRLSGSPSEHSPLPAAGLASCPAHPASRSWARSRGSSARHRGPRGLEGSPERARGRTQGRGQKTAASAAAQLGPAGPALPPPVPRPFGACFSLE